MGCSVAADGDGVKGVASLEVAMHDTLFRLDPACIKPGESIQAKFAISQFCFEKMLSFGYSRKLVVDTCFALVSTYSCQQAGF